MAAPFASRADYCAEAASWAGTPFAWQASLKGVGCDCKGLVWGAARALGLPEAETPDAALAAYDARVPETVLRRGLARTLAAVSLDEAGPGDVLLMAVAGRAQHLGVIGADDQGRDVLIHALSTGPRAVVLTPLKLARRAWPALAAWRFASLAPPVDSAR